MAKKLKDSGTRTQFETGAVRDGATGKGAFYLLPYHAEERIAQHFENGADKYEERNWEKGIPLKKFADSAKRHLGKAMAGMTDEDHWAAAAWNIHCYMETEYRCKIGQLPMNLCDGMPVAHPNYGKTLAEIAA